jgi:hypothetical protein
VLLQALYLPSMVEMQFKGEQDEAHLLCIDFVHVCVFVSASLAAGEVDLGGRNCSSDSGRRASMANNAYPSSLFFLRFQI